MNIFQIFKRAQNYEPLQPHERAILKFLQGLLLTAVTAAFYAVIQLVISGSNFSWQQVWKVAAVAAVIAIFNALIKYFSARGDPELAAVLKPVEATAVGKIQQAK